jgi:hypothetical protein
VSCPLGELTNSFRVAGGEGAGTTRGFGLAPCRASGVAAGVVRFKWRVRCSRTGTAPSDLTDPVTGPDTLQQWFEAALLTLQNTGTVGNAYWIPERGFETT